MPTSCIVYYRSSAGQCSVYLAKYQRPLGSPVNMDLYSMDGASLHTRRKLLTVSVGLAMLSKWTSAAHGQPERVQGAILIL
jgi:hypothetical protein